MGGYTAPERPGFDQIRQWMIDSAACSCELPGNVATQLNETLKSDKELCAIKFPVPSSGLKGGDKPEPVEGNPMIGYRGCFRYVRDPELFLLELEILARVREETPTST
jgi:hypothetical protein